MSDTNNQHPEIETGDLVLVIKGAAAPAIAKTAGRIMVPEVSITIKVNTDNGHMRMEELPQGGLSVAEKLMTFSALMTQLAPLAKINENTLQALEAREIAAAGGTHGGN